MAEQFNFDQFLMEKGFSFTNYGTHNLYEIAKDGHNYAVNLQGEVMTTNESRTATLKADVEVPKNQKSAEKWLSEFYGSESEVVEEKSVRKPRAVKK